MIRRSLLIILTSMAMNTSFATRVDEAIEFEIIIPSYNNAMWCVWNLLSAAGQDYPNFHVTYIDDCSTDSTGHIVDALVAARNWQDKVTVIHNSERRGALENLYNAIHACPDNRVIVTLDGDDFLANLQVLRRLAGVYQYYNVLLTYGQFQEWPQGGPGWCEKMPESIVKNNEYREHNPMPSHLRTFYAWLFKKIKKEDLMHQGKFFTMTWDQAMMFPMLEMAGERHLFISDVLYLYNSINYLSDHCVNAKLQSELSELIREKDRYERIDDIFVAQSAKPLYCSGMVTRY